MAKARKTCCCGCLAVLALVAGAVLFVLWTLETPEGVTVTVEVPAQARSGEPLTLLVHVRNETTTTRTLRAVFFSGDLLGGLAPGKKVNPAVVRRVEMGPFNQLLLEYDLPISAGGEATVRLPATAGSPGTHSGAVHVSIDGLTSFTSTPAQLVVAP